MMRIPKLFPLFDIVLVNLSFYIFSPFQAVQKVFDPAHMRDLVSRKTVFIEKVRYVAVRPVLGYSKYIIQPAVRVVHIAAQLDKIRKQPGKIGILSMFYLNSQIKRFRMAA